MLKRIKKTISISIAKLFVKKNLVIVRVDGGICSQMVQYAFGQLFNEIKDKKGNNAIVKYDLSWFKDSGWDLTHTFRRNFDLEKLFPYLSVKKATLSEIKVYKKFYNPETTIFNELKLLNAPFCLDRYYDLPQEVFTKNLKEIFNFKQLKVNDGNTRILEKIKNCSTSCAVHIRRGDLANNEVAKKSGYANGICEVEYFINAINIIKENFENTTFFFFSDEIEYVNSQIIPRLNNTKMEIVNINSAEDGYLDLFLIANCNHQIASVGSLGIIGYFLNDYENKLLITNKKYYFEIAKNSILLDNMGNKIYNNI